MRSSTNSLTPVTSAPALPPTTDLKGDRGVSAAVGVGESTLRTWEQNWLLLDAYCIGWASQGSIEELILVLRMKQCLQADQPSNHPNPEPKLWAGPSHNPPNLWSAATHEGAGTADRKLQDLHDTWQQQAVQEEPQWGPCIDYVAKARDIIKPD